MPAPAPAPHLEVRRAAERFCTRTDGVESLHSFSFGAHYDAANTSHGLLVAHNEERLNPGAGFDDHPHRDTEVVTWVLEGALAHTDSTGRSGLLSPGAVQRMTAGTGVLHSERNAARGPTRFVQAWVLPAAQDLAPAYEQQDVGALLDGGRLVPVVSGDRATGAPVQLAQPAASLHAARLSSGQAVVLPEAPYLHVFVTHGEVALEGVGALAEGDALRLTSSGGQRVTAVSASELLVWEMRATLGA